MIGNSPAQQAYEGVGFKPEQEKRSLRFMEALGCPGIARFVRAY